MRALIVLAMAAMLAAASAGCLRTSAFRCTGDGECGAGGVCELNGYCSVLNGACPDSGRAYSDSAGQGLSNTCVPGSTPGPGRDGGGIDAAVDAAVDARVGVDAAIDAPRECPPDFTSIGGSTHVYKQLSSTDWNNAASQCMRASASAYLAIPDDAAELSNLVMNTSEGFWVGIDDQAIKGNFVTQKSVPAMFLPWHNGNPGPPSERCVFASSPTEIDTAGCGSGRTAMCECEP